jgi:hypothetical protein
VKVLQYPNGLVSACSSNVLLIELLGPRSSGPVVGKSRGLGGLPPSPDGFFLVTFSLQIPKTTWFSAWAQAD